MRKVLIVDDEPVVCRVLKIGLEKTRDYDVSVCTDSLEALLVIKAQRPTIILVDVNMPGLSGLQLVRQLRTDESTRSIPCIFMTGNLVPGETVEEENVKTASIAKPFTTPELIVLIDRILNAK